MKVIITKILTHPFNQRIRLVPCETTRELIIQDIGQMNYDFAIKEGWIIEK